MYLSFFPFVHNSRARGKRLLQALLSALVVELSGMHQEPKFIILNCVSAKGRGCTVGTT
ncbi:hypothetical protein ThimaDRAFT_3935 [Thiocapsa marina 5811]|uniref:Uncharacterized protein n=1 Tax=Thiocapsa marina 5811 TaxID=768671 RepID=F9UG82_9GAMM|nr:hypothetical protein ThimaDRAFT_3935 [Thiocapsa marina 5811]